MRYDLVNKVLNDLKGIVPYKENIVWEDFQSIRRLGCYNSNTNIIKINTYLDDDQEILDVMAHELIHAAGVDNHRLEFKEYMEKINSLGLGYNVHVHYKTDKENTFKKKQKEVREKRAQKAKNKPKKEYIVWCEECGHNYITTRKCHRLSHYCCPKCMGRLRQKQYKPGKTEIRIHLH